MPGLQQEAIAIFQRGQVVAAAGLIAGHPCASYRLPVGSKAGGGICSQEVVNDELDEVMPPLFGLQEGAGKGCLPAIKPRLQNVR